MGAQATATFWCLHLRSSATTCGIACSYRSHQALNSFPMQKPGAQLDTAGELFKVPPARTTHAVVLLQARNSWLSTVVWLFPQVSEGLLLWVKICLLPNLFPTASARPALCHCWSAFHAVLTRTHLPGMLNVPFMASAKCWLKVKSQDFRRSLGSLKWDTA